MSSNPTKLLNRINFCTCPSRSPPKSQGLKRLAKFVTQNKILLTDPLDLYWDILVMLSQPTKVANCSRDMGLNDSNTVSSLCTSAWKGAVEGCLALGSSCCWLNSLNTHFTDGALTHSSHFNFVVFPEFLKMSTQSRLSNNSSTIPLLTPYKMGNFNLSHRYCFYSFRWIYACKVFVLSPERDNFFFYSICFCLE